MNKFLRLLALPAVMLVAGCSMLAPLPTPSGRPEVVINTADAGRVKDALVQTFGSRGFSLVQDTTYSFVFTKMMEGKELFGYQLGMGSSYTGVPRIDIALTIAPLPSATQVFAHQTLTTPRLFGGSNVADGDKGGRARELQAVLENVKANVEAASQKRRRR